MKENLYEVTFRGISPLIMHWDNIEHSDELKKWRSDPANKKISVAGDDRSPAHTWLGSVYHDGVRVVMPRDNIQRMCMEAGAAVPVPGGRGGKTFKAQSQSGMEPVEDFWTLTVRGREIPWSALAALVEVREFGLHKAAARDLGFELFVKRAKIGQAKHVRVRPRFLEWKLSGHIRVFDEQITETVLRQILQIGGIYKGLGDWRPSSKTPGPFGRFEAHVQVA